MADEACRFHHVPADRIVITGRIQFDRYFRPLRIDRQEFLTSKGMDPGVKSILFAGGRNIFHYYDFYRQIKTQKLPRCNIIIRPYPVAPEIWNSAAWQTFFDLARSLSSAYHSQSPSEPIDTLTKISVSSHDVGLEEEIDELHHLLRYSDVLINFFATISLEASVCDLPVIHVAYDSYSSGIRSLHRSKMHPRHYVNRKQLRRASARIAESPESLLKALHDYLEDPSRDSDKCLEYSLSECQYLDGRPSDQLADTLKALIAGRRKSTERAGGLFIHSAINDCASKCYEWA